MKLLCKAYFNIMLKSWLIHVYVQEKESQGKIKPEIILLFLQPPRCLFHSPYLITLSSPSPFLFLMSSIHCTLSISLTHPFLICFPSLSYMPAFYLASCILLALRCSLSLFVTLAHCFWNKLETFCEENRKPQILPTESFELFMLSVLCRM